MQDTNSIYGLLKESAEKYAGKTAVLYDTFAGSYEKLFRDVTNKAIHLQHFEGKRVALYGPSSYRWIVNLFGIILAGKDVVLVDSFLPKKEREHAKEQIESLAIKCSSMNQAVGELSGGNKQKVSFGKWIGNKSRIIIMDSPTRGVDIGVKTTMYQLIARMKKEGYSILIISEEMPELIGMCDEILVMKDGKVTQSFKRSENLSEQQIIEYMI